MAKARPMIRSRRIKEDLRLPVSTIPARSPHKVPLLKKIHKWRNILWTDESKIVLFSRHEQ
uniref:Transposase Tc1-like domain-containing protein n=1 Tax=Seriola lalandi dorsalis TaxID=1841481 RepID=A0A3B4Z6P7_SERLL